jgi:hypothetical protein
MFLHILVLAFAFQLAPQAVHQDEVKDALARAESLYFEARFKDSIQVLLGLDQQLQEQPNRLQDRIGTKLQLALANVGLNDMPQAKAYFHDLYVLDADYAVDPQQFSPKVIAMANDARTEQNQVRCKTLGEDARKELDNGHVMAVVDVLAAMQGNCPALADLKPAAADQLYKAGVDAYKRGDVNDAVLKFQGALKLEPKHEMALQYIELAQSKQQMSEDRVFMNWQSDFDSHHFAQAAADYRQMAAFDAGATAEKVNHVRSEYRKSLTALVESWNRTCPTGDTAKMDGIKSQIAEMIPEPAFGEDIRSQMTTCSKATGCVQTPTNLALTRLKTQVNPELSPNLRSFFRGQQVTVRVKARIDEAGGVRVSDIQGGNAGLNSAVRVAVEQWKFAPAVDQSGPRCVETELPIVITP